MSAIDFQFCSPIRSNMACHTKMRNPFTDKGLRKHLGSSSQKCSGFQPPCSPVDTREKKYETSRRRKWSNQINVYMREGLSGNGIWRTGAGKENTHMTSCNVLVHVVPHRACSNHALGHTHQGGKACGLSHKQFSATLMGLLGMADHQTGLGSPTNWRMRLKCQVRNSDLF